LEACNDITINDIIINGNVEVNDSNDVVFSANTVNGNITIENATGCNVFDNDANGNVEIGECSTEPPNTPPTIGSVSIFFGTFDLTGFEAVPEITLTCVPNDVIDEDIGDIVSFTFSWFLDGTLIDTGDTHLVTDQLGELVCEVTPFDGTDFGEPVATSITVVLVSSSGCPPNCSGSGGTI